MAGDVRARLTPAEGRKFGLTVGGAFLVLASLLWWRGHATAASIPAVLGLVLLLAAAVLPGRLGPVYRGWMAMALAISKVTTPIFMSIVYILLIMPIGIIRRNVGGNPVVQRESGGSYWKERSADGGRSNLNRQF